jgi:Methyltransferase domain/galactosyl transferase GMA12/MNN10 family
VRDRRARLRRRERGVICSVATGSHVEYLSITGVTFGDYARRWGWNLVLSTEDGLAKGRPPAWGKIRLVRELLDEYHWVLWIDADAIIVDMEADIRQVIQPGKDLYIAALPKDGSRRLVNTGVFLVRGSEWSRWFFDRVWASKHLVGHKSWEMEAFNAILGYGRDDDRKRKANGDRVAILDSAWNSYRRHPSPAPHIRHYAAMRGPKRLRGLQIDLRRSRANAGARLKDGQKAGVSEIDLGRLGSRAEIPAMLNRCGLVGRAAEVGVFQGGFSEFILRHWNGRMLISIDPWLADDRDSYRDVANVSQEECDRNYRRTRFTLARFGPRSEIWRMASTEAAGRVEDESLDFVYIDARHDEASVAEDLNLWWGKVVAGGLLSGHDYYDGVRKQGVFGVKTAVDRFCAGRGLPLQVIEGIDAPWLSWVIVKPKPELE